MRPEDLVRVAELSGQLGYPASVEALERRFGAIATDGSEALFVAERAGRVVGWIHLHPRILLESDPYAEIGGLVVDEADRRTGAGRALVEEAKRWAKARGFELLRVRSNVAREASHRFYPAMGFSPVKTQHTYEFALDSAPPRLRR